MNYANTLPTESFRQSSAWLTVQVVTLQLLLTLLSIAWITLLFSASTPITNSDLLAVLVVFISIVLQTTNASALVYLVLRWSNTTFYLSKDTIVICTGNPPLPQKSYALHTIQDIEVHHSPLGGILGYGTISFADPTIGKRIALPHIPNPDQYAEFMQQGYQHFPKHPL